MPRKAKRYHYIYKTTCNVTNKFYVGMHSTNNLEDGYLGSGKRLWYSRKKYGDENHTKEILEFLDDRRSLKKREEEIVNEQFLEDEMCLNLSLGGHGGLQPLDSRIKRAKSGNDKHQFLMKNDEVYRKNWSSKVSVAKLGSNNPMYGKPGTNGFKGKTHSIDSIELIKKGSSVSGSRNGSFGTVWIYSISEQMNKRIKADQLDLYLKNKWKKGTKPEFYKKKKVL